MGKRFTDIKPSLREFIERQKIFFVATAAADGRVNVSPKGMDSLRVVDASRVVWLNVTGSGNESAAHVLESPRMTLMFCAFSGDPLILRVYGTARVVHRGEPEWDGLYGLFEPLPGARQVFDLAVDLVQTSCGMAVPYFEHAGDRDDLNAWAVRKGEAGLRDYQAERNRLSIDGRDTGIGRIVGETG
ncbi:MAG TPA: pyridoxamine 5'-phosphate oxidase family protein [Pseudomonadales bacterium]